MLSRSQLPAMPVDALKRAPTAPFLRHATPPPCQVARNSLPALAAAPQLEYFCLTTFPDCLHVPGEAELWQQWWDWAATHPPLRCLALEPEPSDPNMLHKHISSLVALARRRPALSIRSTLLPADDLCWCRSSESDTTSFFFFAEELLTLTDLPA